MIAINDFRSIPASSQHIRPMDARRDLPAVADLIEMAFAAQMDADGREYLRQMRRLAEQADKYAWPGYFLYHGPAVQGGLVWEEDGRVIGNLSLIPHMDGLKRVYLIANVAVHPDFRGGGIGRALTRAALDRIKREGVPYARLQVRDDNQAAYGLYRSLDFHDTARRTTWISKSQDYEPALPVGMSMTPCSPADWRTSEAWLRQIYPPAVTWNLAINIKRLRPGLLGGLSRALNGDRVRQWSARRNGLLVGAGAWQASSMATDNLWLAVSPKYEVETIAALLPYIKRLAYPTRPLSVNYPAGQAEEGFRLAGFTALHTLVWMEQALG